MKFEAYKVIHSRPDINDSAAEVLDEPILVCKASGTCVVPKINRDTTTKNDKVSQRLYQQFGNL